VAAIVVGATVVATIVVGATVVAAIVVVVATSGRGDPEQIGMKSLYSQRLFSTSKYKSDGHVKIQPRPSVVHATYACPHVPFFKSKLPLILPSQVPCGASITTAVGMAVVDAGATPVHADVSAR